MSRTQKWLLAWSGGAMLAAEIIKRIPMPETTALMVGAAEVALAIATGIAFGLSVAAKSE